MRDKKIVIVNSYYPPHFFGGAEVISKNLKETLLKKGYEVYVITNMYNKLFKEYNVINLNIRPTYWLIGLGLPDPKIYFKLKKILKHINPEIVLVNNPHSTISSAVFYASREYKIVFLLWDYWLFCLKAMVYNDEICNIKNFNDDNCSRCLEEKIKSRYSYFPTLSIVNKSLLHLRRKMMRKITTFVDSFIVSNDLLKDLLIENFRIPSQKIYKIPLGIKIEEFVYAPPKLRYPIKIGFVGTLIHEKGPHIALKALKILVNKNIDANLLIVGEGPLRNRLETLVKKLNIGDNVKFLGKLNRQEMKRFYSEIDLFVFPVIWPDVFPQVCLEVMASGKIVFAPRIGGISEFLKDGYNGFSIVPNNPKSLADKIVTVLNMNKENIYEVSINARKTILKEYTFETFVKKLEENVF